MLVGWLVGFVVGRLDDENLVFSFLKFFFEDLFYNTIAILNFEHAHLCDFFVGRPGFWVACLLKR